MTVRKLCIIVSLATILFVQEELLTFIPNVQLTFLLIVLYGATLDFKDGVIIICIHVILDNLFMSSFNIFIMAPQFLGLLITLLLAKIFKNKNEIVLASVGALGALIYCWLYVLANIWFLNIRFVDYIIPDIPFEIILVTSTVVSILFLYKPLANVMNKLLNKYQRDEDEGNEESRDKKSTTSDRTL